MVFVNIAINACHFLNQKTWLPKQDALPFHVLEGVCVVIFDALMLQDNLLSMLK